MYERLHLFLERRPAESKRRERRLEYDSCVAGVVADVVVAFHRMSRGKLAAVPARLVRHDAFHSLFIKIIDRLILILDIYVGSQRLLKQKKEKEKNVGNALLLISLYNLYLFDINKKEKNIKNLELCIFLLSYFSFN